MTPLGSNGYIFERELAEKVGTKHVAAIMGGTAAIHIPLKAAGVGEGNTIFCQNLTFSATAIAIIYQDANRLLLTVVIPPGICA